MRSGHRFNGPESLEQVAAVANRPVYGWIDANMGRGLVGGKLLSMEVVARALADVAVRVLEGESPESIPVREVDANVILFYDWRELRRWGISEARLPAGSVVRFRQPGVWDQYKGRYIVGVGCSSRCRARSLPDWSFSTPAAAQTEMALRRSERRYRAVAASENQDLAGRLIRRRMSSERESHGTCTTTSASSWLVCPSR